MGEVEEMLAIGIHLEAICATTNGQLQGEGQAWGQGQDRCLGGEQWKRPQTHIKELSRTKRVVGDLPLLRSPGAIQKAVPNHRTLGNAGVNVQSHIPRGSHLEVDDKARGREEGRSEMGVWEGGWGSTLLPKEGGNWGLDSQVSNGGGGWRLRLLGLSD